MTGFLAKVAAASELNTRCNEQNLIFSFVGSIGYYLGSRTEGGPLTMYFYLGRPGTDSVEGNPSMNVTSFAPTQRQTRARYKQITSLK
jgi:hypothetical protein